MSKGDSKTGLGSGSGAGRPSHGQSTSGTDKDDPKEILERSLRAYKAHFTRVVNSSKRLVDFAPTVKTASTAESLQRGLQKLDDQYDKVIKVIEQLQAVSEADDLEEYEAYLEELVERYDESKFNLLDAIKQIGVAPREAPTRAARARRASGGSSNQSPERRLSINKSLKPFVLLSLIHI